MNNWIPCKERLPEKGGVYLITYKKRLGLLDCEFVVAEVYFEKRGRTGYAWYAVDTYWGVQRIELDRKCVLAWCPLPKPYKEGEQNG